MSVLLLFVGIIALLMIGAPIAIALGLASVLFLLINSDTSLAIVTQTFFGAMSEHYTLLAIPFFILASSFMSTGGVARRIIDFSIATVGHLRGGLAIAGVFACMLFAALSGSSPATVVAIGSIAIAGMVKAGYSKDFAAGVICNAGTLGILIPPSIVMVVYASAVDVSVGRMFLAGIIPGLLAGLCLMVGIYIAARVKKMPKGDFVGWGEVRRTGAAAFWGLMLIVVIFVGIYGVPGVSPAIFTPTEAAAVASVYAACVALFVYRDMGPYKDGLPSGVAPAGWLFLLFIVFARVLGEFGFEGQQHHLGALGLALAGVLGGLVVFGERAPLARLATIPVGLWQILRAFGHRDTRMTLLEGAKLTVMLMFIIANALILKHVLTEQQVPQMIAEAMLSAGFGVVMFLIMVNLLLLIGGQFMEPSGLIVIVAPLVFPIAMKLGVDPIHLGIIMVVNMEIGMITPPVGLNLFVTSGVAQMSVMRVVKAALPWLAILFAFLIVVTYVPILSTFIPNAVLGPEIVTVH